MSKKNFVRFELLGERKPVSFEVPFNNLHLPKSDGKGNKVLKKAHYIKDAPSIWKEDYKGDEKPKSNVFLEDGYLDVSIYDKNLLDLLKAHKMYNKEYRIVDEDLEAEEELKKFDLIKKALQRIDIANEDELKANAFVILGEGVLNMSDKMIKAKLDKKAMNEPREILDAMNANDYNAKYVSALGILRGVLVINPTRTAVTWADGKPIVTVPMGKDPIDRITAFLSANTEEAKLTLQEIGEQMKQSYVRKKEIDVDETINNVIEEDNSELEEASLRYKETFRKEVPNNKKNDLEWILSKLD